jgi:hypothetical protein
VICLLLWTSLSYCQQKAASSATAQDIQIKTLASNIQKLQGALTVLTPDSPAYKPLFDEYMRQTAQLTSLLSPGPQSNNSDPAPKPPGQRPASAPIQAAPSPQQQVFRSAVLTSDSPVDSTTGGHEVTDLSSGEPAPRAGNGGGAMGQAAGPPPGFTIHATSPVISGTTATSTVTVTSVGTFTTPVDLTATGSACTAANCTFSAPTVTPSAGGTTSTLTIVTTNSTPVSSPITITGTPMSGAVPPNTAQVTLNLQSGANNTNTASQTATDILKNNLGFGLALGFATNITGANFVNNATIDANGIVRVNTRANTTAGFYLESHYYVWPTAQSAPYCAQAPLTKKCRGELHANAMGNAVVDNCDPTIQADCAVKMDNNQKPISALNPEDKRWWGIGPFVAAQPGSSQIITAVGGGLMLGWRRKAGSTPSGFGLGLGYEAIPNAQVLGPEFVNGQKAPLGPNGQPLPIRYETQDKGALLGILSVSF